MTMTAADLLAAVIAEPDADDVRLAYADWLEERGDRDRSEFVRCQLALDIWSKSPGETVETPLGPIDGKAAGAMLSRAQWLLDAYGALWFYDAFAQVFLDWADAGAEIGRSGWKYTMENRRGPTGPLRDCEFRRGFIESVTCSTADWLRHGPALVRAQPVRAVRLSDRRPHYTPMGPCYGWYLVGVVAGMEDPCRLPDQLYLPLRESPSSFRTEADAYAALSAACLAWARSR